MANYLDVLNKLNTQNKKKKKNDNSSYQGGILTNAVKNILNPISTQSKERIIGSLLGPIGGLVGETISENKKRATELAPVKKKQQNEAYEKLKDYKKKNGINLLNENSTKNKQDKEYQSLLKSAQNEIKNNQKLRNEQSVENIKFNKGLLGTLEKSTLATAGGFTKGVAGIESTVNKLLRQSSEDQSKYDFMNMLHQKAYDKASNKFEKTALDVSSSIGQMVPQMATGNSIGAFGVGFANYGGSAYNEAKKEGANEKQATLYGLVSGSTEMLMEKALGGFENIYGKSMPKKFTDNIMNKLIKNKVVRQTLSGMKGEFTEEYLQEFLEPILKNVILEEKNGADFWNTMKDDIGEGLKQLGTQIFNKQNLIAGLEGALTSGLMETPRNISLDRKGIDVETGRTKNEQKVFESEVNERIKKAEQNGKKITEKEKTKIEKQVEHDIEKGYISTDRIESILGGETYNQYKKINDKKNSIQEQINELQQKSDNNELESLEEKKKLQDLKNQIKTIDDSSLKEKLTKEVNEIISNDYGLKESYNELSRKSQQFEKDLSNLKEGKLKDTYIKAINSGVLNNSRKTHDFVDMIAKISQEKGIDFNFTDNQRIKESGLGIDGKTINGYITSDGITINLNSTKALNRIVGHELTHTFEGTKLYTELQNNLREYLGETEYNNKINEYKNLYKNIKNANIENELTSDLVGEYLFTDEDFVRNLSTKNRNVFEKIFNEIKYLYKVATSGSKEARQLEKVKNIFERAYNEKSEINNIEEIKYHISKNLSTNIDNILKNIHERNPIRLRDFTPKILVENGIKNLPMYENPSHIRKNILTDVEAKKLGLIINQKDHYHGLGKDTYIKAIDSLDNPRVIFKNVKSGDFIVLTVVKDNNNNNIIIPIEIETTTNVNKLKIDINRIKTVYGYDIQKPDLNEYIKYNIKNNIFEKIYEKKERGTDNSTVASSFVKNNISQSNDKVKSDISTKYSISNLENNTEKLNNDKINLTIKEINKNKIENNENVIARLTQEKNSMIERLQNKIKEKQELLNSKTNKDSKLATKLNMQISTLNNQLQNRQLDYDRRIEYYKNRNEKMNSNEFKIQEQRLTKKQEYLNQAFEMSENMVEWKDKKRGLYYEINTMKRNLYDIMPNEDAKKIYENYFQPISENNAKAEEFISSYNEKIKKLNLNNKESSAVQMLGELEYYGKNLKTQIYKYDPLIGKKHWVETRVSDYIDDYINENKLDYDKIKSAVPVFRNAYDNLLKDVNKVLKEQGYKEIEYRKGYFPHFVEEKTNTKFDKLKEKLGIKPSSDDSLPTDIANLTNMFKPGKTWFGNELRRTGQISDMNALKGFDNYIRGAADVIFHTEDIQKLRALENAIRTQYTDKSITEEIEKINNNEDLSEEQKQALIDEEYAKVSNPLPNFVTELRNYTDTLANKKAIGDRNMEQTLGRDTYTIMRNIQSKVSANMVAFNFSSALTNFIPITQGWGEISTKNMSKAIKESIAAQFKDDGFADCSTYLINRTKQADRLYLTGLDKINNKAGIVFEAIDSITSNVLVRGKYYDNIEKGMSEVDAMKDANEYAKDIMAGRSKGDMPTIFNRKNPLIKLFTAFQLEVNNQYGYFLKDLPRRMKDEATYKYIIAYLKMSLGAWLWNKFSQALTGRKSAFSPIDIISETIETVQNDEKTDYDKISTIFKNITQEMPFVGGVLGGGRLPIQGALPDVGNSVQALTDLKDDKKRQSAIKTLENELTKPLFYTVLPFGGGQLKKTYEGLSMYSDKHPLPGSYTKSGNLRFSADDTVGQKIKAGLFGQYATKYASDYVDSGYKSINKNNIDEMKELDMNSTEYRKYRQGLSDAGKKKEEKLNYINNLDISDEKKNIMASNLMKKDIDMSEYNNYSSYKEFSYANKNPEKYSFLEQTGIDYNKYSEGGYIKNAVDWAYNNPNNYYMAQSVTNGDVVKYKEIYDNINQIQGVVKSDGTTLSNSRKAQVIKYVNSLNLSISQKALLIKQEFPGIKQYDKQIVNYINNKNIDFMTKASMLRSLGFNSFDKQIIDYVKKNSSSTEEQWNTLRSLGFKFYSFRGQTYIKG